MMKVHPLPGNRRFGLRYGVAEANGICRRKELKRLPHIFEKVLELPFHSEADVSVVETPDSLRFAVAADDLGGEIWADAVEIFPGMTKVVVRGSGFVDLSVAELELGLWRIRLPELVRVELAEARYDGGELVVTVPKGGGGGNWREWGSDSCSCVG